MLGHIKKSEIKIIFLFGYPWNGLHRNTEDRETDRQTFFDDGYCFPNKNYIFFLSKLNSID